MNELVIAVSITLLVLSALCLARTVFKGEHFGWVIWFSLQVFIYALILTLI